MSVQFFSSVVLVLEQLIVKSPDILVGKTFYLLSVCRVVFFFLSKNLNEGNK